jgi:hypothetical protein
MPEVRTKFLNARAEATGSTTGELARRYIKKSFKFNYLCDALGFRPKRQCNGLKGGAIQVIIMGFPLRFRGYTLS